ncbi:hypothetical protein OsJ_23486 [Oryza sativa Japonica Group]|uniref:Uncharacterized protein n=1 Tax=Oryza sativa subsp. japonica TaxID=39947 RepID=A3BHL6_ORYSJ|nr:hypothetical protein OsJ_23486 [Oryza sativa Japonica Group]
MESSSLPEYVQFDGHLLPVAWLEGEVRAEFLAFLDDAAAAAKDEAEPYEVEFAADDGIVDDGGVMEDGVDYVYDDVELVDADFRGRPCVRRRLGGRQRRRRRHCGGGGARRTSCRATGGQRQDEREAREAVRRGVRSHQRDDPRVPAGGQEAAARSQGRRGDVAPPSPAGSADRDVDMS